MHTPSSADPRNGSAAGGAALRVGVVGFGYWGPRLVRNLLANRDTRVVAVAEPDDARREAVAERHPDLAVTTDPDQLFARADLDVIAIASPLATHFRLTRSALHANKHVLVEAPLAMTVSQCKELERLARDNDLTVMVDSTLVYSAAVRKMRELVADGRLGRVLSFDSSRVNLGLFDADHNVLWDLATYDLAVLDHVIGLEPCWVTAIGARHFSQRESLAYVTIGYENQLLAHLHVNWVAPVKTRRITITGQERMLVFDDTAPAEPLKLYQSGVRTDHLERQAAYDMNTSYRTGDILSPKLDEQEPLRLVVAELVRAVRTGAQPTTGIESGTRVVRLLEAAQKSLQKNGKRVVL